MTLQWQLSERILSRQLLIGTDTIRHTFLLYYIFVISFYFITHNFLLFIPIIFINALFLLSVVIFKAIKCIKYVFCLFLMYLGNTFRFSFPSWNICCLMPWKAINVIELSYPCYDLIWNWLIDKLLITETCI